MKQNYKFKMDFIYIILKSQNIGDILKLNIYKVLPMNARILDQIFK